jgi:hypothetical protein
MRGIQKLQKELEDVKATVEKLQSDKKTGRDLWDKLSSITPLVTGILITGMGTVATIIYNNRQQEILRLQNASEKVRLDSDAAHQHTLQRIEALDKNMKYLISKDPRERQLGYFNFSALGFRSEALQIIAMSKDSAGGINVALSISQNAKSSALKEEADKTIRTLKTTTPLGTTVAYTAGENGEVIFKDEFKKNELATELIPQLVNMPTISSKFDGKVTFNKVAIGDLKAAFEEIEKMGLLPLVKTWDGSQADRAIRGSLKLSDHALGLAFDINAKWNFFGSTATPEGTEGSVIRLVPIFKKYGFMWGGDYLGRIKDPMHFYWRKH